MPISNRHLKYFLLIFYVQLFLLPLKSLASESLEEILDRVWNTGKSKIAPTELAQQFTPSKYKELKVASEQAENLVELSKAINSFLLSLHISHTGFYTKNDQDYYLFKSMFGTKDINSPRVHHIGAQFLRNADGSFLLRSVLENYPADKAGLRRGDVILSADGLPFEAIDSFADGRVHVLRVKRNNLVFDKRIRPVFESIHFSFLKATQASKRIVRVGKRSFGYLHLWSGTNELFLKELNRAITQDFIHTDGIILDIRDGYGGAWYEYLDPFFQNRDSYFVSTRINHDGKQKIENLAIAQLLLDGVEIEQKGIAPDLKVAYPSSVSLDHDPQLEAAVQYLSQ